MFPMKRLSEMIDSSIKKLRVDEDDKQNWLQHLKNPFDQKVGSEICLILPLFINRSITKYFPIETLLERIDSSVRSPGKFEYDDQNCLQRKKATARSKNW
jgi:hypothetical protein